MSGQYPHPSAPSSQQHQFSRQHGPPHHLPPAPSGQYCPPQGPSQRMRPPPPQQWGHPTHNTGLNTVGGGLVYGSPHLSSYGLPGRSQAWPKPTENRYPMPTSGVNPLFNLLPQNLMPPVVPESRLTSDYNQEETIDLSSHSVNTENRREKEMLRNGALLESAAVKLGESVGVKVTESVVNGEFVENSFKSSSFNENKDVTVSVIAHNPLSDVLNCSKTEKIENLVKSDNIEALIKNSSNIVKSPELPKGSPFREAEVAPSDYIGLRSPDFVKNCVNSNTEISGVKDVPVSETIPIKSPEHIVGKIPEIRILKSPESCTKIPEHFNIRGIESSVVKIPEIQTIKHSENFVNILENSNQIGSEGVTKNVEAFLKNSEVTSDNHFVPISKPSDNFSHDKPDSSSTGNSNTELMTNKSLLDSGSAESTIVENRQSTDRNLSTDSNNLNPSEESTDISEESGVLQISESFEEKDSRYSDPLFVKSSEQTEPNMAIKCLEEDSTPKSEECSFKSVQKMTNDWENSNHTAENVESILENMFNAQNDKPLQTTPQTVIVSNDSRSSIFDELRSEKSPIIVPMKEEELAETLLETQEIKPERVEDPVEKMMDELHTQTIEVKPKEEITVPEEPMDVDEMKENIPKAVVKPLLNQPSALRLLRKNLPEHDKPPIATAATTPIETNTNIESEKNPFIEVESELEKMFAGIVEPAGEAINDNQVTSGAETSTESKKSFTDKRVIPRRKTPNRRTSDNNVFGTEVKKKLTKRLSDIDGKKSKKTKLDSSWESSSIKKGKGFQKDTSNDSGSIVSKSKGPFIHVEGSKENPVNVVVVNSGVRPEDEEGTEKAISRRKHSNYQRSEGKASRPRGSGLYSSTLSLRYDAHTADATWICVFCKRGPHCEGGLGGQPAGDLYGPYRISSTPPEDTIVSPFDRDVAEEQKRRGGGKQQSLRASGGVEQFVQKMARKNKRMSTDESESVLGMTLISGENKETGYEVWTHEHCATWAPGVYIVGSKLVGIEEAVWATVRTKCNHCGDSGAGLGCVVRNCAPRVHYGCALLCSWHLNEETFIAKCNHHRKSCFATEMLRPS